MRNQVVIDNQNLKKQIDDRMNHPGYIINESQYNDQINIFAENGNLFKILKERNSKNRNT